MKLLPTIKKTALAIILSSALACNGQLHSYQYRIEEMKKVSRRSPDYNPAGYVDQCIAIIKDVRSHEYDKQLSDKVAGSAAEFLDGYLTDSKEAFDREDLNLLRDHLSCLCQNLQLDYSETYHIVSIFSKLKDQESVPLIVGCIKRYAIHRVFAESREGSGRHITDSFYFNTLKNIGGPAAMNELADFAMQAEYIDDLESRLHALYEAAKNTGTYEAKKFAFDVIFDAYRNVPKFRRYYNERALKSLADDIGVRWDMEHESPVAPVFPGMGRR